MLLLQLKEHSLQWGFFKRLIYKFSGFCMSSNLLNVLAGSTIVLICFFCRNLVCSHFLKPLIRISIHLLNSNNSLAELKLISLRLKGDFCEDISESGTIVNMQSISVRLIPKYLLYLTTKREEGIVFVLCLTVLKF